MSKFFHTFAHVLVPKACSACPFTLIEPPAVAVSAPFTCSRCHTSNYCNKECQAKDWPKHKKNCKIIAARNAAEVSIEPTAELLVPLTIELHQVLLQALSKRPHLKQGKFVVIEWARGDDFDQYIPTGPDDERAAMVMLDDGVCSGKFEPVAKLCPGFTKEAILFNGKRCRIVLSVEEFIANEFIEPRVKYCAKQLIDVSTKELCVYITHLGGYDEIMVHAGTIPDKNVEQ